MTSPASRISTVLKKYGEVWNEDNVWKVQGTPVINHKVLERIAVKAKIKFDLPVIIRAEGDEAVIMVVGKIGEQTEWSFGEAKVNVNYRVSGKQAAYVYAMAEKRGKDRVILKLIELHGFVYSEEEADELKNSPRAKLPEESKAIEERREKYIADCLVMIGKSDNLLKMREWWSSQAAVEDREHFNLSDQDTDRLVTAIRLHFDQDTKKIGAT